MYDTKGVMPGTLVKAEAIESDVPGVAFIKLTFAGAEPLGMALSLEGLVTLVPVLQDELTRLTKEITTWQ